MQVNSAREEDGGTGNGKSSRAYCVFGAKHKYVDAHQDGSGAIGLNANWMSPCYFEQQQKLKPQGGWETWGYSIQLWEFLYAY
jgi:hypothetical protein